MDASSLIRIHIDWLEEERRKHISEEGNDVQEGTKVYYCIDTIIDNARSLLQNVYPDQELHVMHNIEDSLEETEKRNSKDTRPLTNSKISRERLEEAYRLAEESWDGCHGCTENDKYFYINGYVKSYLRSQH